jgi:hypothetical protein
VTLNALHRASPRLCKNNFFDSPITSVSLANIGFAPARAPAPCRRNFDAN